MECHKLTWERLVWIRVEVRTAIDYVKVPEKANQKFNRCKYPEGCRGCESDHFLAKGVLKIGCA